MASVRFLECLANFISFTTESDEIKRRDLYNGASVHTGASQSEEFAFLSDSSSSLIHMTSAAATSTSTSSLSEPWYAMRDSDSNSDSDSESGSVLGDSGINGVYIKVTPQPKHRQGRARRMSSISRVAWRWGLNVKDAAELCTLFEQQQSPSDNDGENPGDCQLTV